MCNKRHHYFLHVKTKSNNKQQQQPFRSPLSGTTWVNQYQKGKTNLDLLEQETVSGSGISGPYVNLHLVTDR